MSVKDFVAENDLEKKLIEVANGHLSQHDFLELFLKSMIYVPVIQVIKSYGTEFKLLFHNRDSDALAVAFTSGSRVTSVRDATDHCLAMEGAKFLKSLKETDGIVVNPGFVVGFELLPHDVRRIVSDIL